MTITWCMVPEIWSMMDKTFCHFGPFFALKNQNLGKMKKTPADYHLTQVCHKWQYVWFLRYEAWRKEFLSFWTVFCPFTSLATRKIKILKNWKKKKKHGHIIILHKCPKNHDHILYCSLDMACNRRDCYFSFWTIFALLPP